MKKGDTKLAITLTIAAILIIAGYFLYKKYIPEVLNVLPSPIGNPSSNAAQTPSEEGIVILEPKAGSRISSPLTIRGTVPPGWMFEGVFPVRITDSNRNLIVEGQAKEEVPGSWQSGTIVYFTATMSFSTTAKAGFIVLVNDNPSGDPSRVKTYEVPITF